MDTTNLSTQLRAGIFVILGLLCIGSLVIYFGRFGESIKKFYTLTVEYRNASGLLKGADVTLSGAKIGEVAEPPRVLPDMRGVSVLLKINNDVQIPRDSVFSIGSSGLLGDRYVSVTMREDGEHPVPIEPGSIITNGVSESSIAELQRQIHDEILPKLDSALGNIDAVSLSLRNGVFNEQGVRDLQLTLSNFATASSDFRGLAMQAGQFLRNGNEAMGSVKGAAGDLKAFVANLRQHGILFYRDTAPSALPARQ